MSDVTTAPAERATGFLSRLHPVTRIVVAAAIISFCGDLMQVISVVSLLAQGAAAQPLIPSIGGLLTSIGYSLGYVGAAASVEYLFRIWREVRLMRERSAPNVG